MGSFNVVCNVSNQVLREGRKVVNIFTLKKKRFRDGYALVNMTDEYLPISFPFIAVYADYGRFELVPKQAQNTVAWELLSLYMKENKNVFPDELQDLIEESGNKTNAEDFYTYLMENISNVRSSALSFMSIDYNIYENMISRTKREPAPYKYTGTLQETSETYFKDVFLPRAKTIFEDLTPYVNFLKAKGKMDNGEALSSQELDAYKLYEETPSVAYDMFRVMSKFEDEEMSDVPLYRTVAYDDFFTTYHTYLYVYLANKYEEDNIVLSVFIDSYAMYLAMKNLHVPYNRCILGSQTENFEMVAESVAGTIKSMRQDLINSLEMGSDIVEDLIGIHEDFWLEATMEHIEQVVNELSTDDVLTIYIKM